jgi:hypothetical protein
MNYFKVLFWYLFAQTMKTLFAIRLKLVNNNDLQIFYPGLWSRYTKLLTLTPPFLKL